MYFDAWLQSKVIGQNQESWDGAVAYCFEKSGQTTKSGDIETLTRFDKSDRRKAKENQPIENLAVLE